MYKYCYIIVLFLSLFCVVSCSENSSTNSAPYSSSIKEDSIAISSLKDVIINKKEFFSPIYGKNMLLKDFHSSSFFSFDFDNDIYYFQGDDNPETEENFFHEYSQFCIFDLDGDGIPEFLLESDTTMGNVFIFHYSNDVVYGYVLSFRNFLSLKTDGTFTQSISAGTQFIGKITFMEEKIKFHELCAYDSIRDEYRINSKDVSETEAEKRRNAQDEKEDAPWFVYTENNVKNAKIN